MLSPGKKTYNNHYSQNPLATQSCFLYHPSRARASLPRRAERDARAGCRV